jgi:hypothetical protein
MAGLGRKTWSAGEVVTAANVQGYLQDQTVQVFTNTSAVSSAVGTALSDGMQFFLTDTDETVYHNGTSFAKEGQSGNAIINGAFDIWQRGTTFTGISSNQYTADRWFFYPFGAGQPATISKQTSTPPTGFTNYLRLAQTSTNTSNFFMVQTLETAETVKLAGQTVTISFWYKIPTNFSGAVSVAASYNTATDSPPTTIIPSGTGMLNQVLTNTTTWTRASYSFAVPSTATSMAVYLATTNSTVNGATLDFTGVQLEAGSVATPFKRNAPSIQAELAACQRYYQRITAEEIYSTIASGQATGSTTAVVTIPHRVTLRSKPTSIEFSTLAIADYASAGVAITGVSLTSNTGSANVTLATMTVASGLTTYRPYVVYANNSTTAYLGLNAEL